MDNRKEDFPAAENILLFCTSCGKIIVLSSNKATIFTCFKTRNKHSLRDRRLNGRENNFVSVNNAASAPNLNTFGLFR